MLSLAYLIETDPRFANYHQWLSSDYGSKTVSLEPGATLLFDGQALHGIEQILERPVTYLSVVSSVRG